jgi:hypothetical protein
LIFNSQSKRIPIGLRDCPALLAADSGPDSIKKVLARFNSARVYIDCIKIVMDS